MIDPKQRKAAPTTGAQRTPELLEVGEVFANEGEPAAYRFSLSTGVQDELTFLLECHARDFPFENYCRFVRHPGKSHPYTFSSLEFHKTSPGIRVGPWPGWRGIPAFPEISASSGKKSIRLQPTFWGDEIATGILRMFGRFPHGVHEPVTLTIPDLRIKPRRVFVYRTHAMKARPHPAKLLPELIGVHPRLLITPGVLKVLRDRKEGTHQMFWRQLVSLWENRHLPFAISAESKCVPGPERLSEEDRVLISALIALVTEQEDHVRQAVEQYMEYVRQTGLPSFEPLGIDTQAGEALFILSTGYDWLFSWMSGLERKSAWEQIERVAAICASYLTPERTDYGQAHYLGCGLGLLAYSFLASDDSSVATARIAELRGALDCALDLLAEDGSYPHGINLWIYEFGFLLRWLELFRCCSGDDLWVSQSQALERASVFRASTLSADARHGITFGDPQYRVGGDSWCHFLIARRIGSGLAQWMGNRLLDLPHEGVDFRNAPARRRVYEFLFYDPSVSPKTPGEGIRAFPEIGQATVRSRRTLFTMRSGAPLGYRRYETGEYGAYGHSDPASGSFLIERDGRFIASGPGPVYRRDTTLHNVLTIDGKGQLGDSTVWLPDFIPPEVLPPSLEVNPVGPCAALTADLTKAYLPYLGVRAYRRHVFVDPERFVLGTDRIRCDGVHDIEWNAHSRLPMECLSANSPMVFNLGGDVRLILLSPATAMVRTGLTEFIPAYPNDGTRDFQCTVTVRSEAARFIWCYLLNAQAVPALRGGMEDTFSVEFADGRVMDFNGDRLQFRRKP